MLENFITAKDARHLSEKVSLQSNDAGIDQIYKLIEATARMGFNKVVITAYPHMIEYIRSAFPMYRIEEVMFREPLHLDKVNLLIIW